MGYGAFLLVLGSASTSPPKSRWVIPRCYPPKKAGGELPTSKMQVGNLGVPTSKTQVGNSPRPADCSGVGDVPGFVVAGNDIGCVVGGLAKITAATCSLLCFE